MLRLMGPALVLLLTIIPPPGRQEQAITLRLQYLAVRASSGWLDVLGVPHVQSGNVLQIPGRRLLIEQACSGINSLMAVLAFSLLYGFWKQRSAWRIALLLPAAAVFVVVGNIVRITGEAWLKVKGNVDVLDGAKHQLMGLGLFVGCVGLVVGFDAVIERIFGRRYVRSERGVMVAEATGAGAGVSSRVGRVRWVLAVVFVLCGGWVEGRVWNAWGSPHIRSTARFEMPERLSGWEKVPRTSGRVERPQTEAATSFIWQYRQGDLIASVAIDYPFTGYHALTTCYAVSGWTLGTQSAVEDPTGAFMQVEMTKAASRTNQLQQGNQTGYLLFGQCDERGKSVVIPPGLSGNGWAIEFEVARRTALGGPTYQTQVLVQHGEPLSERQRTATRDLYLEARRLLSGQLVKQMTE